VRRLLLLVSAVVLVDSMLYSALVPLLPRFADEYGLSKAGAGLLVAAYAAGALAGGLPGGIAASRVGPRRTVLAGLALMTLAGFGFAFAGDVWSIGLARLAQGVGSSLTWAGALTWLVAAAPREGRGQLLGTAMGAAIFGALFGPVLGAVASHAGRRPVFAAVALLGILLAVWAARTPPADADPQPLRAYRRVLAGPEVRLGMWLMLLPALLFGLLAVLAPLALDRGGWGSAAIGGAFLAGAALEAALSPVVGRVSDRRGRLFPVRLALSASAVVCAGLALARSAPLVALLVVAAAASFGTLWVPALALLADGAERIGLAQGLVFGLMSASWALGNSLAPSLGGAVARVTGDAVPYAAGGVLCLVTWAVLSPRAFSRLRGRPAC
jgi:MFS family permease